MSVRPDLEQLPAGTELLRNLRYMPVEAFAEFTDDELGNAERWLWAARYSCTQGALLIARILASRPLPVEEPCSESEQPVDTGSMSERSSVGPRS